MKKLFIPFLTLLIFSATCCAMEITSRDSLDYYISRQSEFDKQKEERISEIKEQIRSNKADKENLYKLYLGLYEEYRSYVYDSAYVCVERLIDISTALKDRDKIISSKVKLGFCFLSSGLFKEAFDTLTLLDVTGCSSETRIEYYSCKSRLYFDLADYNNSAAFRDQYNKSGNEIIDSAIILLNNGSARYWSAVGLKNMKLGNADGALEAFHKMIDSGKYSEHDLAIATSSIAYVLSLNGRKNEAKNYLVMAAIADIKSSVKETVALRNLAQFLYEDREITAAVSYIRKALDDASFYNARHRQLEIGNILPIIEGERINMIENQRDSVIAFSLFISFLLIALLVALFIIRKSYKRLNAARQAILDANNELVEANKIKDEYIGYFFNQNSEFIEKLETLQKWVIRKVSAKQYDDLKNFPQSMNIRREREALFERFDQIFLKLFPNFVEEFNKLLKPEEQVQLKKGELLNTDLRIYALIRLGINDNEKIANFLNYSVNTIYAYKTKIKGKAICASEEFKQKVLEIKSI